jgi:hypothetical protein
MLNSSNGMTEEREYQWASSSRNRPVVGNQPSPVYIPFLAIANDDPPREAVTPFLFASQNLCALSTFLSLLTVAQPSLDGYMRNIHTQNTVASWLIRFAYWIIICFKRNFNASFVKTLNHYIARVVYIQGEVPEQILALLTGFGVPAIVICESPAVVQQAIRLGLDAHLDNRYTRASLGEYIGSRFAIPTAELLQKGYTKHEVVPAQIIGRHGSEFNFSESRLQPVPVGNFRVIAANEILANSMRRRLPGRAHVGDIEPNRRVQAVLDSAELVMAQKHADYLIARREDDNAETEIGHKLAASVERYWVTRDSGDYETLVGEARKTTANYPNAQDMILCCPAINRQSAYKHLRKDIPDRVLKYVFKQRAADYLNWLSPADIRKEDDVKALTALMMVQSIETGYIDECLTLYALALRRPALRTPQLSGGLFGRLKHLRLTYAQGSIGTFAKRLPELAESISTEIPAAMTAFLASHRGSSLKIISDLPIEWLPIDGVPLMFRQTLSRVPITPGNVLLNHYSDARNNVHMGKPELRKILVLNCMSSDDPLFRDPKLLLGNSELQLQYAEVKTVDEYRAALEKHEPYILIHWGHGSYDRSTNRGYLHIGQEGTEVWEFRDTAVPPIVILAACETSAIAETHNTPANAWLAIGARAVLGTYFPVQADLTIVLITRILANLAEAITGKQVLPTWELVVSKTLALNRYLDFLYGFDDFLTRKGLQPVPREFILEYTFLWNDRPERDSDQLYRLCPEIMVEALQRFDASLVDEFRNFLALGRILPHTMFFTHLGSPESILLRKGKVRSTVGSPAERYWRARLRESREH